MSLNTTCLESQIQCSIENQVYDSGNVSNFVFASFGIDKFSDDRKMTVAKFDDLPAANSLPDGQLIYVEEYNVPLKNSNGIWIGLDGRLPSVGGSRIFTWGDNTAGSLGDGTTISRSSPGITAGGGTNWCNLGMGRYTSVAVKINGTLWTWGSGSAGALGDGTTISRCSPGTTAGGGTDWCHVSAGRTNASAVKTNGTLWTWGCNAYGALGDSSTTDRCSPGTTAGGGTIWFQSSSTENKAGGLTKVL